MRIFNLKNNVLWLMALVLVVASCSRDTDELDPADFPTDGDVFIDGFSGGLQYAAFGGSDVTGFDTDTETKYKGTTSMVFRVPDVGDPAGAYVGGTYFVEGGRDLSGYNVLSFWAKASKSASIDVVGFGNDLGENKYVTTLNDVKVNTNWKQFFIPIPDASKLTQEKGMFFYSEGPEDGNGYTFWIDEVKFEKLGTIGQTFGSIQEGADAEISAETGAILDVNATATANLADGRNVTVSASPAFFEFLSSDEAVATVNDKGQVMVLAEGSSKITASLAGSAARGSLTITSTGAPILPASPAPTPTYAADKVISMYSDAYTNVPVDTWNTYWEFSTAVDFETQVDGDNIRRYRDLNFVGIEFVNQKIDASGMTHFHIDVWTPDATDGGQEFKVLLVDFGADGAFGGDDDSSHEVAIGSPPLATESWVGIDIPLSDFAGLINRNNLAQLVLSGDLPNVFIDNVYFYNDGGNTGSSSPDTAAPNPAQDGAGVISIFSDAYTNVDGTDFNPDWGQSTQVNFVDIEGNNTMQYAGFNYQGIQFASPIDVSAMNFLHIDYWSSNSSELRAFLISDGPVETPVSLAVPTTGWGSMDIPLSQFSPVDLMAIIQMKFDGNGTIYLDNIYFHGDGNTGGGDEPMVAAPTPTHDAAMVVSLFSDSYPSVDGLNLNPNWGQSTMVSEVSIDGNNTLNYSTFNYQGTEFTQQDLSTMEFLHIDLWTADATDVLFSPISVSSGEFLTGLSPIVSGQWNSYDIPLTVFTEMGVSMSDIIQIKMDGQQGVNPSNLWLDNIYFYRTDMLPMTPSTAAPTPVVDPAKVVSIYSDSYSPVDGLNLNPNWGQSTQVSEIMVEGNNTLAYNTFNYQGTEFMQQDLSALDVLHIDMWTADATKVQMSPISASSGELLVDLAPINAGVWNSYDIPLTVFTDAGMTLADVFQLKFDGQTGVSPSNIYLDNIYFYQSEADGPGSAAPIPAADPSDVISVFSDSYDAVADTDLNPNWGQATQVSFEDIEGNSTMKYTGLNYQGIMLGSAQDVSDMSQLHLDVWTNNSDMLRVFIISTGPVETPVEIAVPTNGWLSLDIPLSDFAPVDLNDVIQLKFEGNGDVYLDNIYFVK